MIKLFVSLFTVCLFFSGSIAEAIEMAGGHEFEISQYQSSKDSSKSINNQKLLCEDCESEGCSDTNGHCSHHCGSLHLLQIVKAHYYKVDLPLKENQEHWFYDFRYKGPVLDPSIKPPLFS